MALRWMSRVAEVGVSSPFLHDSNRRCRLRALIPTFGAGSHDHLQFAMTIRRTGIETATGSGLVSRRTANGYQSSRTIMIRFAYGRTNRLTLSIGLFER
jgi:hypothetical protein